MSLSRSTIAEKLPPARVWLLALPLGILADAAVYFALWAFEMHQEIFLHSQQTRYALALAHTYGTLQVLITVSLCSALFWMTSFAVGMLVRTPWSLSFLRKSYLAVLVWFFVYAYLVFDVSTALQTQEAAWEGVKPDAVRVFYWRFDFLWPAVLVVLAAGFQYLTAWRRATMDCFVVPADEQPARGDVFLENVRTHGEDPQYRKSWLSSVGLHVFVIILLPLLLQLLGCVEPYRVPFGSGNPVVALVKIVKPKKEKKKTYILRPNSAIVFHVPDLDESEIIKQIEEQTQLTYKADPNARAGKMGRGGGTQGGWPEGMKNGVVRFIRLEYNGAGWDDGMSATDRADINFLQEFKKLTGFKVASKGESHPVRLLKKYDKGFAPPFVYFTGDGNISMSDSDVATLREYLLDGGMLFADCGSPSWDRAFRSFAPRLGLGELRNIADDDPLFQMPYTFADGAPPLWHHGGMRALGIKHKGRWVVFYHPGDVNDAWKTGHSGMNPELARGAIQMGVNIVYYAFTQYLEQTAKYRK
jgi:hypothetical protein